MADANLIADKLDEARALIEKGWTQGTFSDRCGSYCALGAVLEVTIRDTGESSLTAGVLARAIGLPDLYSVPRWNDDPKRKKREVVEAFRKAAELARAELAQ